MTSAAAPPPRRGRATGIARYVDTETWSGCLVVIVALAAVLWIVEIANQIDGHGLDRFGLRPRTLHGLEGIVTMPFLHAGVGHLAANTIPFLVVGWVVLVGGLREFLLCTLVVVVLGGALTWMVGPSATVVGASALVFGWLAYLLARAFFSRRIMWIVVAIGLLVFFGGLFTGLLPSHRGYVAWQAHVCGFVAGIAAGWWLHPRKGTDRYLRLQTRVQRS